MKKHIGKRVFHFQTEDKYLLFVDANLSISFHNSKKDEIEEINTNGCPFKMKKSFLITTRHDLPTTNIIDMTTLSLRNSVNGVYIDNDFYAKNRNEIFNQKDDLIFKVKDDFIPLDIFDNKFLLSKKEKAENILECIDLYNQSHHWEFDITILRQYVVQWQDEKQYDGFYGDNTSIL